MLKPYEFVKEVPAGWITTIPNHWTIERIGSIFTERKEKVSDKDYPPLSVTKNGILPQLANAAKSDDGDNRKLVLQGDFVINSRSDRKGSSGVSSLTGSVSLINIVLEPRIENNGKYLHYLLKNHKFIEEYYRNGRGIVADLWTTRFSEMKTILLPVPPKEEQDQIVRFLDWKLAKINKLIKAKKQQIVLMNEQKQAIVDKVLGNGESLLPDTWEKVRLKFLATKFGSGVTPKGGASTYISAGIPLIRSQNVYNDGLRLFNVAFISEDVHLSMSGSAVKKDDVLLNITGASIGRCCHVNEEIGNANVNQHVCIIRANKSKILPAFLCFSLLTESIQKSIKKSQTGAARDGLTQDTIKNFIVNLPPLSEQHIILDNVNEKISIITNAQSVISKEIDYLLEYKTSLISSVVTGKVDIRSIEVPDFVEETEVEEPDELEEAELLEDSE